VETVNGRPGTDPGDREGWLRRLARRRRHDDAGEIQGWVFVTVMTAGLVYAIWALAEDQLKGLFEQALSSVTGG
jgi:hypothetical protein